MAHPTDERLEELTDKLENGIKDLFASDRYAEYLSAMSKFHRYSYGNAMLILMQCPHATRVAGYNTWRKSFGRNVKRSEKGICILAPCPTRKYVWQEVKDPKTGATIYNKDGSPKMETRVITITRFKIATVFDVSQTEGRELPSIGATRLTGEVDNFQHYYDKLRQDKGRVSFNQDFIQWDMLHSFPKCSGPFFLLQERTTDAEVMPQLQILLSNFPGTIEAVNDTTQLSDWVPFQNPQSILTGIPDMEDHGFLQLPSQIQLIEEPYMLLQPMLFLPLVVIVQTTLADGNDTRHLCKGIQLLSI